jgi:ABC-type uncharacterized transport system permease subunit
MSDPIAAVLRPGGNLLVIVFGQFLWCFLLSLLAALLWYCGVRRYEAAGG